MENMESNNEIDAGDAEHLECLKEIKGSNGLPEAMSLDFHDGFLQELDYSPSTRELRLLLSGIFIDELKPDGIHFKTADVELLFHDAEIEFFDCELRDSYILDAWLSHCGNRIKANFGYMAFSYRTAEILSCREHSCGDDYQRGDRPFCKDEVAKATLQNLDGYEELAQFLSNNPNMCGVMPEEIRFNASKPDVITRITIPSDIAIKACKDIWITVTFENVSEFVWKLRSSQPLFEVTLTKTQDRLIYEDNQKTIHCSRVFFTEIHRWGEPCQPSCSN